MARYLVHVKGEGTEALSKARFVRDDFSLYALSFGPFWLLAKGAWNSALLVLACQIALAVFANWFSLPEWVPMLGFSLINLLVALESGALRSWELGLKGFRGVGLVAGDNLDQIEQRFFASQLAETVPAPAFAAPARANAVVPVIGLFPSPPRGGNP
jgi:hypothetical protein